ncbi:hypothetical protein GCM10009856_01280 [Mycolicibacterium llatzerense]
MKPATNQKPIKKMTSIHKPLYTHHRWALVLIVVSLQADGDVRSEKLWALTGRRWASTAGAVELNRLVAQRGT